MIVLDHIQGSNNAKSCISKKTKDILEYLDTILDMIPKLNRIVPSSLLLNVFKVIDTFMIIWDHIQGSSKAKSCICKKTKDILEDIDTILDVIPKLNRFVPSCFLTNV